MAMNLKRLDEQHDAAWKVILEMEELIDRSPDSVPLKDAITAKARQFRDIIGGDEDTFKYRVTKLVPRLTAGNALHERSVQRLIRVLTTAARLIDAKSDAADEAYIAQVDKLVLFGYVFGIIIIAFFAAMILG